MGFFDVLTRLAAPFSVVPEENESQRVLTSIIDPIGEFAAGRSDIEQTLDPLGLFAEGDEDEVDLPDPVDPVVEDEDGPGALAARRRSLARKGRQSTFRTGGQGVVQTATLQKPTLVREG